MPLRGESPRVDSGLLNNPAPLPSVRALQSLPEVLTPVRHGFLWKRSRLFKTWLSRWYQLDERGFLYAASPKIIGKDGGPVLSSAVREVVPLQPATYGNGATMYGIRIISVGGGSKDVYTDDRALLEAWALDLSRSTPAARQHAHRKAAAAAAATAPAADSSAATYADADAAAAAPALPPRPPRPAAGAGELHLSDICETDWSAFLGTGLFACVLRGRMHGSGEPVAVKVIKAEAYREYRPIIHREAAVWSAVGEHPHIAGLRQALQSHTRMYFISELCEGGGLVERLAASATYCEREAAWLTRQLLAAVAHLHAAAIVHMDIKPENLVFASRRDDSTIKLIDFSLASFFFMPTDPGGTPDFVAPELLNAPEHYTRNGCGPEVDMWAVGVMLFFLLSGQTPFQASSLDQVLERVKAAQWAFHGRRWALVSEGAKDLIAALLRPEPERRLTAAEALRHPWLRRPDRLSQALLADAITAFRASAAAAQAAQRNSWVKQGSDDLLLSTMNTHGLGVAMSPCNSLSRAALLAAAGAQGVLGHAGSLMGTSVGTGADGGGYGTEHTSAGTSNPLTQGGHSMRGSRASGASSLRPTLPSANSPSNASMAAVMAAAAAAAAARGGPAGPLQHSFTSVPAPGVRGVAAAAAAAAAAGISNPIVAAAAAGRSPTHSPGGTPCSPRSPLGVRARRASDTMAYALAITERNESISQMQAQGLAVPPSAGMQWPQVQPSRARRASDMSTFAPGAGGSASGEGASAGPPAAAAAAAAAAAVAMADSLAGSPSAASAASGFSSGGGAGGAGSGSGTRRSNHSAPGVGRTSGALRASGLSVVTSASSLLPGAHRERDSAAALALAGRSTPELPLGRKQSSSSGMRSGGTSSAGGGDLAPVGSTREGAHSPWAQLAALQNTQQHLAAQRQMQAAQQQQQQQQQPAPPQLPPALLKQQQLAGPMAAAESPGPQPGAQAGSAAGGGDSGTASASGVPLSTAASHRAAQPTPGALRGSGRAKSFSYNARPRTWLDGAAALSQSRPPAPLQGRASTVAGGTSGATAQPANSPPGPPQPSATQRRASTGFLGTAPSTALAPHGPSPLSNSSKGHTFVAGALAAVAESGSAAAARVGSGPLSAGAASAGAGAVGRSSSTTHGGTGAPSGRRGRSGSGGGAGAPGAVPGAHSGGRGSGSDTDGPAAVPPWAHSVSLGAPSMYATVLRSAAASAQGGNAPPPGPRASGTGAATLRTRSAHMRGSSGAAADSHSSSSGGGSGGGSGGAGARTSGSGNARISRIQAHVMEAAAEAAAVLGVARPGSGSGSTLQHGARMSSGSMLASMSMTTLAQDGRPSSAQAVGFLDTASASAAVAAAAALASSTAVRAGSGRVEHVVAAAAPPPPQSEAATLAHVLGAKGSLGRRPSSRVHLEPIPSEDPDSLTDMLRPEHEEWGTPLSPPRSRMATASSGSAREAPGGTADGLAGSTRSQPFANPAAAAAAATSIAATTAAVAGLPRPRSQGIPHRSSTITNLRQHVTTAAAAIAAAAQAAKEAAETEDDPFAGWTGGPGFPTPAGAAEDWGAPESPKRVASASAATGKGPSLAELLQQALPLAHAAQAAAAAQLVAHSSSGASFSSSSASHRGSMVVDVGPSSPRSGHNLEGGGRGGGGNCSPGGGSHPLRRAATSADLAEPQGPTSGGGAGGGSGEPLHTSTSQCGTLPPGMPQPPPSQPQLQLRLSSPIAQPGARSVSTGPGVAAGTGLAALLAQAAPLAAAAQANAAAQVLQRKDSSGDGTARGARRSAIASPTARNGAAGPYAAGLPQPFLGTNSSSGGGAGTAGSGAGAGSYSATPPGGVGSPSGGGGGGGSLAALLGQAAPLAAAAQASAAAQAAAAAASRGASFSSQQSAASGAGGGAGGYSSAYGSRAQSLASVVGAAGMRSATSHDLRERLATQVGGGSTHRLASQAGASGLAVGASPPRELSSPASSRGGGGGGGAGGIFAAVPSRLSNSGAGTPTGRPGGGGTGGAGSPALLSPTASVPAGSVSRNSLLQQQQQAAQLHQLQQLHSLQQQLYQQQQVVQLQSRSMRSSLAGAVAAASAAAAVGGGGGVPCGAGEGSGGGASPPAQPTGRAAAMHEMQDQVRRLQSQLSRTKTGQW